MTKIIKTGSSLCVVLPVNILKPLNWQRGDILFFTEMRDDVITLKRLTDLEMKRLKEIHDVVHNDL